MNSKNTGANTGAEQRDAFKSFAHEQALDAMEREAREKGSDVTREQIEAAIEHAPEGNAARRFGQYEELVLATAQTLHAMHELGIDPREVDAESFDRAVEATQGVLQEHEQLELVPPAPDLDLDADGPDYDEGPSYG